MVSATEAAGLLEISLEELLSLAGEGEVRGARLKLGSKGAEWSFDARELPKLRAALSLVREKLKRRAGEAAA